MLVLLFGDCPTGACMNAEILQADLVFSLLSAPTVPRYGNQI